MKTNVCLISFIVFSVCIAFIISACTTSNESQPPITRLQHTTVTSHLEEQIDLSNNLLYCASFQMAWNVMRDQIIKSDIRLEPDTSLAKHLNRNLLGNKDISPESYVATAGELSQKIVTRINKELKEKFDDRIAHEFNVSPPAGGSHQLIAYAFLYKNLEFPTEFEKLDNPIIFIANGRETPVTGFGIKSFSSAKQLHNKLSNQVAIIDYRNENDFILLLTSKSDNDQLILAKINPDKTLLKTYESVIHRIGKAKTTELKDNETLRIPKVDFDISHSFSELENKRIMNKGWEGWSIAKANQDIDFKLNEKGAVLKSRAFMVLMEAPPPENIKPRKFIFDKPFLICLKQKTGVYPYFALWASNPELFIGK